MHPKNTSPSSRATPLLLLVAIAVSLITAIALSGEDLAQAAQSLFQTNLPTPTPTASAPVLAPDEPVPNEPAPNRNWISSSSGGSIIEASFVVILPQGFTSQGGASVYVDRLLLPVQIQTEPLVSGTQLTVGIWPPNDQTRFEKAISIVARLDAAQTTNQSRQFEFRMYNPALRRWVALPSTLNRSTGEIRTEIKDFTPVGRDFPIWGGRSLVGVFAAGTGLTPTPTLALPSNTSPLCLVATSRLNLRAGPGLNYAVVTTLSRGQRLLPSGQSGSGAWLQVRVAETNQRGWVSGSRSFVLCNNAVSSLPATTGPTATPTRRP